METRHNTSENTDKLKSDLDLEMNCDNMHSQNGQRLFIIGGNEQEHCCF